MIDVEYAREYVGKDERRIVHTVREDKAVTMCGKPGPRKNNSMSWIAEKSVEAIELCPACVAAYNPAESAREAFKRLAAFVPESKPPGFTRRNTMYAPGDEKSPLFSEAFTYPLFGFKDDARTFLCYMRQLEKALNDLPPSKVPAGKIALGGKMYVIYEETEALDREGQILDVRDEPAR